MCVSLAARAGQATDRVNGINLFSLRPLSHAPVAHLVLFPTYLPSPYLLYPLKRRDFEDFLRDRVATIRLLKMVQGDATALREHCPDVCLRGLEPYECNSLNQELQCQRQWHQRVVLAEQSLQKKQKQDLPERIRRLAVERSEWAGQRARQLASMDEMEVKLADAEPQMRRKSLATAQIGMENLMLTQQHQQQRRRATLSLVNTASRNPVGLSSGRVPVDLAILKEWNAKFMDEIRKKGGVPSSSAPPTTTVASPPNMPSVSSLSDKTAQSRMALQRGVATSMATSQLGYGEMLTSKDATAACFRFPVRRDSLVGFRRESLMASRAAALTGGAAAASSSTSPSAATGGFRFPVRRDSLSNVHWN